MVQWGHPRTVMLMIGAAGMGVFLINSTARSGALTPESRPTYISETTDLRQNIIPAEVEWATRDTEALELQKRSHDALDNALKLFHETPALLAPASPVLPVSVSPVAA